MSSGLQAIADPIALRLFDSLVEGTAIFLLTGLGLRLAPRQNASTRFAVWFSALAGIFAFPWIGGLWPHSGIGAVASSHPAITVPDAWALYALVFWACIAAWFGFGVVRALWHVNALRNNCVPLDSTELDPIVRETLRRHARNRSIVLATSEQVRVPTAVGLFQPTILLPGWVLRELSPAELKQIVLHELAHFTRWDDWTNLAQQIVKAIFFFHPAVWWIDQKVAVEREMACDDAVLAETQSPRAYAECLAHLAEKSLMRRSVALAQAAVGKLRQTSARIAEILGAQRPARASRPWAAAASMTAVLAIACAAVYSATPRLIAFGGSAQALSPEVADGSNRYDAGQSSTPKIPITQAKLKMPAAAATFGRQNFVRKTSHHEPVLPLKVRSPKRQDDQLIHMTGLTSASVPLKETFWVVVEGEGVSPAGPEVYQIRVWRVTVLRTVITAPSRQIPPKQT